MQRTLFFLCSILPLIAIGQITQYPIWNKLASQVDEDPAAYNWTAVGDAIGEKDLVFLGEFTHGAKEVFAVRNDLIRYLHREKGFQVVLFEAGLGEMASVYDQRDSLSYQGMTQGLFGGWRTPEFEDLMGYIDQNYMEFAGFDVQSSGRNFHRLLHPYLEEKAWSNFNDLEDRFQAMDRAIKKRGAPVDSTVSAAQELIQDYDTLIKKIGVPLDRRVAVIAKTLENRKEYLRFRSEFLEDQDWNKRWAARDQAMANNTRWLIENFFPGLKVIVIGHNFHLARYNEKEAVMGAFLQEYYKDRMYVIGNFAALGSFSDNYGRETEMKPLSNEGPDIKSFIASLDGSINFVPIPEPGGPLSASFWNPLIVNDTFIDLYSSNQMVLGKHFDGLLLIRTVSPSAHPE